MPRHVTLLPLNILAAPTAHTSLNHAADIVERRSDNGTIHFGNIETCLCAV